MDQIALPEQLPPPEPGALTFWTIYDHPKDWPHGFVLRAHYVLDEGRRSVSQVAWYAKSADELRAIMPRGTRCMGRRHGDDEAIVEVWL